MSLPYASAMEIAEQIRGFFQPACAEIVICGSLRREAMLVKDIELVACLHDDRELRHAQCALDGAVLRAMQTTELRWDEETKRKGEKYKRFILPGGKRFCVDGAPVGNVELLEKVVVEMFIAERGNFGNQMVIRTGDKDFTHRIVTQRRMGGLLPNRLRHDEGYLWEGSKRLSCPTESDFFTLAELPFIAPRERTLQTANRLRERIPARQRNN